MITHSCVCLEARSWAPICLTALLFRTSLSMAWCLRSATWWWIQWFKASQQFVTTIAVWNEREGRIDTTKCILHFGVVCFHICFQLLRLMARRWANGWRTIQIPRSLELINFFCIDGWCASSYPVLQSHWSFGDMLHGTSYGKESYAKLTRGVFFDAKIWCLAVCLWYSFTLDLQRGIAIAMFLVFISKT